MSWLFSQVLVDQYLGENFLDGQQSVQSSGKPTQQAFLSHDKTISSWSRFPSGMMPGHLTESLGEELLMSYREAFHVPTSQPLEKALESMEKPLECGEKWHGSFAKLDPNSSLWKTHQCSLVGDLDEFLGTWPQWGSMRNGECWERQTLAHLTKETEFGLSQNTPPLSKMAYTKDKRLERWHKPRHYEQTESRLRQSSWSVERSWLIEPKLGRVAHGVANRIHRLKAIGNGQVPLCAATAWRILSERN